MRPYPTNPAIISSGTIVSLAIHSACIAQGVQWRCRHAGRRLATAAVEKGSLVQVCIAVAKHPPYNAHCLPVQNGSQADASGLEFSKSLSGLLFCENLLI